MTLRLPAFAEKLSCGHARVWRKRYPWCRICSSGGHPGDRRLGRYVHHKKRKKPKYIPVPNSLRKNLTGITKRRLDHKREAAAIRVLFWREGRGALKNLGKKDADRVRAYWHKCYDEYVVKKKFEGGGILRYRQWRRRWWAISRRDYTRIDLPKLLAALEI